MPLLERRLQQARLEVAALTMAMLRDRLVASCGSGLLLRTDTGSTDASDLILASALEGGSSAEDARAEVQACMSARRCLIEASGLFDAAWYHSVNSDVAEAGVDALHHFNHHGSLEGRDPGPWFNCRDYLSINSDVATAQVEPFLHYLLYGSAEGRQVQPAEEIGADAKTRKAPPELPVQHSSFDECEELDEVRQDAWLSGMLAEISDLRIRLHIAPTLLTELPVPLARRLSTSRCIDIDSSVESPAPFSIAFASATDAVTVAQKDMVCVRLLDVGSVTLEELARPSYRVGRLADLEAKRQRLARALPPDRDREFSPVFHLYRASDRVIGWPAVAIRSRGHSGDDRGLARLTALNLAFHHLISRDGAGALTCLDDFDRRFGSDMARRYKAITGSFA